MKLTIDEMATFCKRKGFVYQTSEIYGGFSGFFDFGPLGTELKNNIKRELWKSFVQSREDIVGIDGAIISHPKVWEASGHVTSFEDVMVSCTACDFKARADTFIEEKLNRPADGLSAGEMAGIIKEEGLSCPKCKSRLKEPSDFNLMLKTDIGAGIDRNAAHLDNILTIADLFPDSFVGIEFPALIDITQVHRLAHLEAAAVGFFFADNHFEQGRFARTVGADNTNDTAGR